MHPRVFSNGSVFRRVCVCASPSLIVFFHCRYANTSSFCSASDAQVQSWGSLMFNNTNLTPPSNRTCPMNASFPGRPYHPCKYTVTIKRSDGAPSITTTVEADVDDCFRMEGCSGTWGPAGRTCEKVRALCTHGALLRHFDFGTKYNTSILTSFAQVYKDTARWLVTTNGTIVGEGTCCVPSVQNTVASWQRISCRDS